MSPPREPKRQLRVATAAPDEPLVEEEVTQAIGRAQASEATQMIALDAASERPRLRRDLLVTVTGGEVVRVRAPESSSEFPIYKFEWRVAQWMDGTRTLPEVARLASRDGMTATEKQLHSLVRELRGYRFLETAAMAAPQARRNVEGLVTQALSGEERSLAESAVAMAASGNDQQLGRYLSAILQVNPANEAAKALLVELSTRLTAPPVTGSTGELPTDAALIGDGRATEEFDIGALTGRPTGRISKVVMIGGGAALAALVAVGVMLFQSNRALQRTLDKMNSEPVAVAVPRTVAAPVRVRVQLQAAKVAVVTAPAAGVLADLPFEPGMQVAEGETVAVLTDPASVARYMTARRDVKRVEMQARNDRVVGFFLKEARDKFRRITAKLRITTLTAPAGGRIGKVHANVRDKLAAGAKVLEIEQGSELVGVLAAAVVTFPRDGATCALEQDPMPCRVAAGEGDTLRVVLPNEQQTRRAGDLVDVWISPAIAAK